MFHLPIGAAGEAFAAAFGVTAALLLVGGSFVVRSQRARQQFLLMQSALDRGLGGLPGLPPFWVLSLRQGVMTLTLGVGLLVVGGVGYALGSGVEMPAAAAPTTQESWGVQLPPQGSRAASPEDGATPRSDRSAPPLAGDRPRPPEIGFDGPRPPPPNPAMEQWHRAQVKQTVGLVAASVGFILILLGGVRISFAGIERRHAPAAPAIAPTAPPTL